MFQDHMGSRILDLTEWEQGEGESRHVSDWIEAEVVGGLHKGEKSMVVYVEMGGGGDEEGHMKVTPSRALSNPI
jgi:hypothetical protein